jgi:hypothetical protein
MTVETRLSRLTAGSEVIILNNDKFKEGVKDGE